MKPTLFLLLVLLLCLPILQTTAQDAAPAAAPAATLAPDDSLDIEPARAPSFLDVMLSGGVWGLLVWLGILLWSLLTLPLGILSIVQCARAPAGFTPLAPKLLGFGALFVVILGLSGFLQGMIYSLFSLATNSPGMAQTALLAMTIAHALYSLAYALFIAQINLLFLLPVIILLHNRRKHA